MMKKSILVTALAIAFLFVGNSAIAQTITCEPIFGGGQMCPPYVSFSVSKLVQKPVKNGEYVSNLSEKDQKFEPNQSINFHIVLKNTGDTNLYHITVQDLLPDTITYVSGNGSFDPKTKVVKITQDTLSTGQSVTFTISGKIVAAASLPKDNQSATCSKNTATATAENGLIESSSSSFCIEKNVLGASVQNGTNPTTTPATGAESLVLLGLLPLLVLGLSLRKIKLQVN